MDKGCYGSPDIGVVRPMTVRSVPPGATKRLSSPRVTSNSVSEMEPVRPVADWAVGYS